MGNGDFGTWNGFAEGDKANQWTELAAEHAGIRVVE